jgi:O-antigen/teichoic acid export membrane protein
MSASDRTSSPATAIRDRLIRGSGWVLAGKVLASVLQLVVVGVLLKLLGKKLLGVYFLSFQLAQLGATISLLGLERAIVRLVAAARGTGRPMRARKAVRVAFTYGALGSLFVAAVLVIGFGNFLAHSVYHSPALAHVLVFTAGWLIAIAMQTLLAETFRGFQRFLAATIVDGFISYAFSAVVFTTLWLLDVKPTIGQVVLLSVGFTSLVAVVAGWAIRRQVRTLGGEGDLGGREVFSLAWPLLAVNLASYMTGTGVDLFVVGAFRPLPEVAIYGVASRLVFLLATPFIIVSQVVPPIVAELHAQGRKGELQRSLRMVATLAAIPAAVIFLVFVFFGRPIMGGGFGNTFRDGATVLVILSVARLVAVGTGSCGVTLMMTGHQREMMNLSIFAGVLGVSGEFLLARPFGIVGVASASATAQIIQNVLMLTFARRQVGIWTHAEFSLRPVKELVAALRGWPASKRA